jgi:hypothetical protein
MSYIDAGYAAALGTLAAYAVLLWYRRRHLERLATSVESAEDEV